MEKPPAESARSMRQRPRRVPGGNGELTWMAMSELPLPEGRRFRDGARGQPRGLHRARLRVKLAGEDVVDAIRPPRRGSLLSWIRRGRARARPRLRMGSPSDVPLWIRRAGGQKHVVRRVKVAVVLVTTSRTSIGPFREGHGVQLSANATLGRRRVLVQHHALFRVLGRLGAQRAPNAAQYPGLDSAAKAFEPGLMPILDLFILKAHASGLPQQGQEARGVVVFDAGELLALRLKLVLHRPLLARELAVRAAMLVFVPVELALRMGDFVAESDFARGVPRVDRDALEELSDIQNHFRGDARVNADVRALHRDAIRLIEASAEKP